MATPTPKGRSWEHPPKSGIVIAEIPNRTAGRSFGSSWQVRIPAKLLGKPGQRERFQFATRAEAEKVAEDRFLALRKHGTAFAEIPPAAQREAVAAWGLLKESGLGFLDAVKAGLQSLRPAGGAHTVAEVVAELRVSKERRHMEGELREKSWRDWNSRAGKIVVALGVRPVSAVTVGEVTGWFGRIREEGVGAGPLGARSVKNYRNALAEIFAHAHARRYCAENPFDRLTSEDARALGSLKGARRKIGILTPEQARALLEAATAHRDKDLLGSLVLRLFCGLRTEEVCRLRWEAVRWRETRPFVILGDEETKTRSARGGNPGERPEVVRALPEADGAGRARTC